VRVSVCPRLRRECIRLRAVAVLNAVASPACDEIREEMHPQLYV